MFRWRRGKSVPTEAAPAAPSAPPVISLATGQLAAIAARLHGGPIRPTHVPTHKAVPVEAVAAPAAAPSPTPEPTGSSEADPPAADRPAAEPDLRPLADIVHAALAHHFGPEGAWALVRRTPDTTAGFFDEMMTAHIGRDVALALGASPAAAALPLEDARATGSPEPDASREREEAARRDAVVRELSLFDADPLDDALAELAGDPRRVPAELRAVRSA